MEPVTQRGAASLLAFIALVLGMTLPAAAFDISLGVNTALDAELLLTDHEDAPDRPKTVAVEARNTGSKTFSGRIRIDLQDEQNTTVFRTWSDLIRLKPGERTAKTFRVYRPQYNGTLTAITVLHHGTRRVSRSVTVNTTIRAPQDGFVLRSLRADGDSLRAMIIVPPDVGTFTVTVNDPSTRRYVQRTVRPSRQRTTVTIPYHPSIQEEAETTVTVTSADGRYHYTTQRTVTKQTGVVVRLTGWIAGMVENLPFT